MASYRSSNRRASRLAFAVLAAVAMVATGVVVVKSLGGDHATPVPHGTGQATGGTAVVPPTPSAQLEQTPARATLTTVSSDPARPATTRPVGDASQILQQATAKRDAGDLVTARNLVNDGLVAGSFSGADLDDAKAFNAALNDKIVFGTQKFPADGYNKEWKVEPGTVLVKLAKRFDVTAELLCRVNGLSSPSKLRAGVSIKAIQGPFYLVVSKGKFTADIYLGAPGGEGSMYVKTLRVGLGSDGSTPTGTWLVDTGKVSDPVYYPTRGGQPHRRGRPRQPDRRTLDPAQGHRGRMRRQRELRRARHDRPELDRQEHEPRLHPADG